MLELRRLVSQPHMALEAHTDTRVEIRFKNNGLDSIEVSDNGKGIAPEDYESIGKGIQRPHERCD